MVHRVSVEDPSYNFSTYHNFILFSRHVFSRYGLVAGILQRPRFFERVIFCVAFSGSTLSFFVLVL